MFATGGVMAACAGSACMTATCSCCGAVGGAIAKISARALYVALFVLTTALAVVMRDYAKPMLAKLPWVVHAAGGAAGFEPEDEWFGAQAVYRVSLGAFVFFAAMSLLLADVRDRADPRDAMIQHGNWTLKVVAWVTCLVFCLFFVGAHSGVITAYVWFARVASGLFLCAQASFCWTSRFCGTRRGCAARSTPPARRREGRDGGDHGARARHARPVRRRGGALRVSVPVVRPGRRGEVRDKRVAHLRRRRFRRRLRRRFGAPGGGGARRLRAPRRGRRGVLRVPHATPRWLRAGDGERRGKRVRAETRASAGGAGRSPPSSPARALTLLSVAYSALRCGSADFFGDAGDGDDLGTASLLDAAGDGDGAAGDGDEADVGGAGAAFPAGPVRYSYSFFHGIFALASAYLGMLLTGWGARGDGDAGDAGTYGTWTRAGPASGSRLQSAWITSLLYAWTVAAPFVMEDRDFL